MFWYIFLSISDYPSKATGQLVSCSNCGRGFAKERIEKHLQICKNTKERQIYDIAKIRIVGTEAEELYKAGELYFISCLIAFYNHNTLFVVVMLFLWQEN